MTTRKRDILNKVFIDVGCGDCDDLFNFWEGNKDYIYYGIDPSNNYYRKWEELKKEIPKLTFINKAAWIRNEKLTFYDQRNDDPQGSTLIKEKINMGKVEEIIVDGFDFSEWLKQFKNDYVIVFMDIEGAEYDVLNKMFEDGTISIPKKIFYESHAHKVANKRIKELCSRVEQKLKKIRHHKLGGSDIVKDEYFGEKNENNKQSKN